MIAVMVRDPRDPIYHDIQGEKAEEAIMRRSIAWVENQDEDVQQYFCEHGRYVGFGGALKFKCERCTPGYED